MLLDLKMDAINKHKNTSDISEKWQFSLSITKLCFCDAKFEM